MSSPALRSTTNGRSGTTHVVRSILLVVGAVVGNIALGHVVKFDLGWPLYLDSVGTILVGALLGPPAGAATGVISTLVSGLWLGDAAILPYAITAAFIGWAAGFAVSRGAFQRFGTVVLTGLLVGLGAAIISAPITAYVFGGVTGGGGDFLTAYLSATGANLLQAATIQGFLSDPVDKCISFILAWLLWRALQPYFRPVSQRGTQSFDALHGYSLAVAASIVAVLFSFVFLPAFGRSVFSVFYVAVLLSAWRGGLGPAVLTTVIGVLAGTLLLNTPFYNVGLTAEDGLRVGVFVVVSLAIAVIADRLERSRHDLDDSLQAERQSRARIRAVTDGVEEALMLVSADRRIVEINQRFTELFGVPAERLRGQNLEDTRTLYDQVFADAEALYELTLTSSADSEADETRMVVQHWPEARELQLFTTPIRDSQDFLGRLFVFRDVTHEREVDRMKTEFVSLVSHELRTPLTSIKGFTEMVLDGDAGEINDEVAEYLGIVYGNVERLVSLVNDLLDLSRIESGRIQLHSDAVDLQAVVDTVVVTLQPKIREKGQSLTVAIDPEATQVIGDADKLVQVLTNYASNAYKYSPEGGTLRIDVRREAELALVEVTDDGYGIAPEDQDRLFTRFYRVDNSMTREVGGTGLGLSIVKQLVELQGGTVGVRSALGQGSTFTFTVPLAAADAVARPGVAAAALAPDPNHPAALVLIVEDEPDIGRLIAHQLEKAGYATRIALTAEEALDAVAEARPDLITLDIQLPGMQGDELAARLRDDPSLRDIPVVVLSVLADEVGTRMGAHALPKPIDQEELVRTVGHLLQPAHQGAQPQGTVLVIDDDAEVRHWLQSVLGEKGFDVEAVADGQSGLARARAGRPGVILLDVQLPGMDGFKVLQALKEDERTLDIPVIAMTGSPDLRNAARPRVLALGASDVVAKPFDVGRLVEELEIFLAAP